MGKSRSRVHGRRALLVPAAAQAGHRPSAYRSPSGDYCQAVKKSKREVRKLKFATFSLRGPVRVCVKRHGGERVCRGDRFRDHNGDGVYVARICWQCRFPSRRGGAYAVTWKQGNTRIGRARVPRAVRSAREGPTSRISGRLATDSAPSWSVCFRLRNATPMLTLATPRRW